MSKILVVDDEANVVKFLKDGLERENFDVCTATDGKQVLHEVRKSKPDLILLDVMMDKMSGFEALKQLKKDKKTMGIPIFMLTGKGAPENVEEGIRGYADKYFTKPFDFKLVLEEIRKTLVLSQP